MGLQVTSRIHNLSSAIFAKLGMGLRAKLIIIFLLVKVLPLILLAVIAWRQVTIQGDTLKDISVKDSSNALHDIAVENIERMSTTLAAEVASFLYSRDDDIKFLAASAIDEKTFKAFIANKNGRLIKPGQWVLAEDEKSWVPVEPHKPIGSAGTSTNHENNDMDGFQPRPPDDFPTVAMPLYDEITFVGLDGQELIKVLAPQTTKKRYPLNPKLVDVSKRENTYVKAETYFKELKDMEPGELYVSDVIGAYVGTNFIGMYTPANVFKAAEERGHPIEYAPEKQAYAGRENPNGIRFEGIVRWASPVAGPDGNKIGYVTMALNHDHIMEFVDHVTPMNERTTILPSAYEGNYAFIWDYKGRSICHPRHHSIVGFDPLTGEPEIPWLETSIHDGWKDSQIEKWTDYVEEFPIFFEQSRSKKPAPALTKSRLVGLDCRYLNNAPQCTGWMDLTRGGGSGSLYILWSGLYKLNTAAAIPYYTGHYAPSEENNWTRRGFAFVAIGSGLDYFTKPARDTEASLAKTVADSLSNTFFQLVTTTGLLIILVVFIAIWMASFITNSITTLIKGISRFRAGERQFRFGNQFKDEFATLAESFDDMATSLEDSYKNPISIINMEGKIIYMNSLSLERYNTTLEKIVGTTYADISVFPPNSIYCPLRALQEGYDPEVMLEDRTGRYIKGAANYLLDKYQNKAGFIIETQDVTEMVHRQLELEKAMKDAKRANEHKGEFLAHMSHEIRTPMNAIIGLSSIVRSNLDTLNTMGPELIEVKDNVKQIESSSLHLLGLLNDILDLSKIEAGKIELVSEVTDLKLLAHMVTSIMSTRCKEKNINFITDIDSYSPSTFLTDPLHLRQVLINLLGNSVKFTPELGTIEFSITRLDSQNGKSLMSFLVRDTGIGISDEALKAIFRPFEQGGLVITKQYGGTGLGLTISRHIVNLFGSDIQVKSEVGKGSEFRFDFWLQETNEKVAVVSSNATNPKDRFKGKRVLLVDDVPLNRKIARAMLKVTGISVDEADDGAEALKKFEQSPENTYDMVLMDVQMPIMDGYQASNAIRKLQRHDAQKVPIIALTANAFKEDIDKALEAGMNAHIAKPIKPDKIIEIMSKYMETLESIHGPLN
ncbi:MAG: response regulator [Deltaproteobacteria bacterium]|jgi:signal transduction histidine kinase/ActR/RegA family two-component response regulator|nr:response regulator [Deltaproteobacteria bacterium]